MKEPDDESRYRIVARGSDKFSHRRGPLDNRVYLPLFMARNLTVVLTSDRLWRPTLNHLIP